MSQLQGRYFLLVIFVVTFMMSLSGEGFPLRTDKKKPSLKLSPLDGTVAHFTIIGDYGRQGADNQLEVAQQMANWCTNVAPNCDFTIGVGDNFYPSGVSGVHDSQFQSSFEDIYRPRGAFGSQFYNAFGNHEYYGYAHAEVEYSLRYDNGEKHSSKFYLPNEYYARVISVGDLNILLAVFDTSPMIESYYSSQKVNMTALVLQKDINRQLAMMQQSIDALSRENQISFKLAVGHHPIKSAGKHGDNADISNKLEPFLQKNGFYVYLSGHDHNLQYLSGFDCNGNNCMHQIISGGGSKVHKYEIDPNHPGLKYYLEESAFTAVQLTKSTMSVSFINHKGHVKAQFDIKNPTP